MVRQTLESLLDDSSLIDVIYVVLSPEAKQEDWNDLVQSRTTTTQLHPMIIMDPSTTSLPSVEKNQDTRILYWKGSHHHQDRDHHFLEGSVL